MEEWKEGCIGFSHCVCGIHAIARAIHKPQPASLGWNAVADINSNSSIQNIPPLLFFLFWGGAIVGCVLYCCLCRASTWDPLTTVFFTIQKRFRGSSFRRMCTTTAIWLVCIIYTLFCACVAESRFSIEPLSCQRRKTVEKWWNLREIDGSSLCNPTRTERLLMKSCVISSTRFNDK